jgi:Cd2+/Zn2+-exporting ATPase
MEAGIKSLDGIEEISIDFVSKRLSLKIAHGSDVNIIMEKVTAIINRIESHVILVKEKAHKHEEGDEDDHHHHHDHSINKADMLRFILGVGLFLGATIFRFSDAVEFLLYFTAYLLVGSEVLLKSIRNIARGQVFDENFLMSIATVGAFAIGEYPEGVAVMLFYQIGEFFQDAAVNNSRKSIKALMDIRPDYANLKLGEEIKKVSPEEIKVGDIILIKPGEKVPLDGKVIQGSSMVDTTALTGESIPRDINVGDVILSGFINKNGLLTVEVRKEFGESTVSKILDLVQNASSKKAPTESFITKFARYYTPVVVFIALGLAIIPPLVINGATFSDWVYRALIFLVVSCPCALVVSIPLGFFGGIGGASKNGILIKGSNYLEALNDVDIVVFDKTGTLTKGVFEVTEVKTSNGFTKDELLEYAAYAESYSTHPIAMSIVKAFGKEIDKGDIQDYDEISGYGIKTKIKAREVLAGNSRLMQKEGISYTDSTALGSIVHIAIDKSYAGYIVISDELKQDSAKAIKGLHGLGIKKIAMLTGDMKSVGEKIAKELGLDEVHAELLPDQKVQKLEELEQKKGVKRKLVFVGDGINDAPVLARADIGIAMGGLGSDAAIEAADIVIMTDEPYKIISAIKIARRTRSIVWQNIIFAMLVKGIVLLLGAGGLATMWEAVFADVGVAVVAILNAARIINIKES